MDAIGYDTERCINSVGGDNLKNNIDYDSSQQVSRDSSSPLLCIGMVILLAASPAAVSTAQTYITTDSSVYSGVKLLMGSEQDNCRSIRVLYKGVRTYTPLQLTGYGKKGEFDYVSRTIAIEGVQRRVFLNRRIQGPLTLYSYNSESINCFFLETASGELIPLLDNESHDFRQVFQKHMLSCAFMEEKINLVTFEPKQMSRLVEDFNTCSPRPFPHYKWGIVAGYGLTKLSLASTYNGAIVPGWEASTSGLLVGLSSDLPLNTSYFSIHADLLFSISTVNSTSQVNNATIDVRYNSMTIDLPMLLRYKLPLKSWRPFLNGGVMTSLNFESKGTIYTATNDAGVITTGGTNGKVLSKGMWGIVLGAGAEFDVRKRNSVWFELRVNEVFGETDSARKSQMLLLTGYTF